MDTQRNLLFGVLALQLEMIDAQQLAEAYRELDGKSLPDWLRERGWLSEADESEIARFVDRKLGKFEGDVQQTLAVSMTTELRDNLSVASGQTEVTECIAALPQATETVELSSLFRSTQSDQRYTLLRVQGQGGLGRVWVARDQTIGREVALKEMRTERVQSSVAHSRFLREAQITGRLEHPNIVPVYEMVQPDEDTAPYYTMRLVHGQTLNDAIRGLHGDGGNPDPLRLRQLLNAFLGVCHAVGFAHAHGVVHRDLKPANVLLGEFGEAILLDWGLAKEVGATDSPDFDVRDEQSALATQMGDVVGTPAYMAPEQAGGDVRQIDTCTDVYGLGGLLYAILTGQAPHRGEVTAVLLQEIKQKDPPRPSASAAQTPKALDEICVKAMAREPEQRYATAQELRMDVERWLADEPVSVCRDTWAEQLGRWLRKHRTAAVAGFVTLAFVSLVSLVAVWFVNAARDRERNAKLAEQSARERETTARREADERRRQVKNAIATWQVGVADRVRYHPRMQQMQAVLLQQAVTEYQKISSDVRDDPEMQAELARTLARLGDARVRLGQPQLAVEAYRQAIETWVALSPTALELPSASLELAKCRDGLGSAQFSLGQFDHAEAAHREALDTFPSDTNEEEESALVAARLTFTVNLAKAMAARNRYDEARSLLQSALSSQGVIDRTEVARARALGMTEWGRLEYENGRYASATQLLEQSVSLWSEQTEADPDDPVSLDGQCVSLTLLAAAWRFIGDAERELAALREAIAGYDALIAALPDVPHYRHQKTIAQINLAQTLHRVCRNAEAKPIAMEALKVSQLLVDALPEIVAQHATEAAGRATLGHILRELGETEFALAAFRTSADKRKQLADADPNTPRYKLDMAISQANHGRVLCEANRLPEGEAAFQEALGVMRQVLETHRNDVDARRAIAMARLRLADCLWRNKREEEAKGHYREAAGFFTGKQISSEDRFEHAFFRLACPAEDYRDSKLAQEITSVLIADQPHNGRFRSLHGAALARNAEYDRAVKTLIAATQLTGGDTAFTWFYLSLAQHSVSAREAATEAQERAIKLQEKEQAGNLQIKDIAAEISALE